MLYCMMAVAKDAEVLQTKTLEVISSHFNHNHQRDCCEECKALAKQKGFIKKRNLYFGLIQTVLQKSQTPFCTRNTFLCKEYFLSFALRPAKFY